MNEIKKHPMRFGEVYLKFDHFSGRIRERDYTQSNINELLTDYLSSGLAYYTMLAEQQTAEDQEASLSVISRDLYAKFLQDDNGLVALCDHKIEVFSKLGTPVGQSLVQQWQEIREAVLESSK